MDNVEGVIKVPQFNLPRKVTNSHILDKHVVSLDKVVNRKLGTNQPVSTFPNPEAITSALKTPNLPKEIIPGNPKIQYVCDEFCGWGLLGTKADVKNLRNQFPDPAKWTLHQLKTNNIDFVITKEAVCVHGPKEATAFPIIKVQDISNPSNLLKNDQALKQLKANSLQEAVNPSHIGWKKVSSGKKFNSSNFSGKELSAYKRPIVAKAIGKILVVVAIVVETVFFVRKWEISKSKIAHCVNYGIQVGLIVGGYVACESVATIMSVAGFTALSTGLATFGVGLIIAGIGIGVNFLIDWIVSVTTPKLPDYCHSLRFDDIFPLYIDVILSTTIEYQEPVPVNTIFKEETLFVGCDFVKY